MAVTIRFFKRRSLLILLTLFLIGFNVPTYAEKESSGAEQLKFRLILTRGEILGQGFSDGILALIVDYEKKIYQCKFNTHLSLGTCSLVKYSRQV